MCGKAVQYLNLLFVIAVEILTINVRQSFHLKEFKINTNTKRIKIRQHAGDIVFFLNNAKEM